MYMYSKGMMLYLQVFYQSDTDLAGSLGFLHKQRYFVGCAVFNGLVYLLLLSDVVATPLVTDAELVQECT